MKENKEIGIDVVQLFKVLWKKKIIILLTAVVAAVLAFGVSSFVLKPEYASTTRIYVVSRNQSENAGLTNQDLQAGTYLVKDYNRASKIYLCLLFLSKGNHATLVQTHPYRRPAGCYRTRMGR